MWLCFVPSQHSSIARHDTPVILAARQRTGRKIMNFSLEYVPTVQHLWGWRSFGQIWIHNADICLYRCSKTNIGSATLPGDIPTATFNRPAVSGQMWFPPYLRHQDMQSLHPCKRRRSRTCEMFFAAWIVPGRGVVSVLED